MDFNKCLRAIFSQLSFENFWLYLLGEVAEARLKNMLVCCHQVYFFEYTWSVGKKKLSFLDENDDINLMNIKKVFDPHVSCRSGREGSKPKYFYVYPDSKIIKDDSKMF